MPPRPPHDSALAQLEAAQALLSASEAQLDSAKAKLEAARAQIKQSEAELELAQVNLDHTKITAPVTGIVISRNVDVGQTVAASLQAPTLFTIAQDLTEMQVDTNVSEADIGRVAIGQEATFTVDAFPNLTFQGKVTDIRNAPVTVQNVVTYDVVILVKNPELKLRPGMTANASILVAQRENVLKIPNAALRFRPEFAKRETAVSAKGATPSSRRHAVVFADQCRADPGTAEGGAETHPRAAGRHLPHSEGRPGRDSGRPKGGGRRGSEGQGQRAPGRQPDQDPLSAERGAEKEIRSDGPAAG